jgi:hypothetical protein
VAKPAAAIVILLPGLRRLKEGAYAGVTFALVMAAVSAYVTQNGFGVWIMPLALLAILLTSCFTRPASRRLVDTASAVLTTS